MIGLKKHELFEVPSRDFFKTLEDTVISWMDALNPGEHLVATLLPLNLENWEGSFPLVLDRGMQDDFKSWLSASRSGQEQVDYDRYQPTTSFLCMVIETRFDPRSTPFPADASPELTCALKTFGEFISRTERKRA